MNAHQVLTAWSLALLGNVLFFSAAHHASKSPLIQHWDKPIAVVGTSLVAHGLPDGHSITGSLLGDGRKHVRVGLANPTELEILTVANQALAQNPQLLFLEANPFIRSFNPTVNRDPDCRSSLKQIKDGINNIINSVFSSAHDSALRIMGRNRNTTRVEGLEPTELDLGKNQNSSPDTSQYPMHPRPVLCPEHLRKFLLAAKAKKKQVILVLPPRSSYGEKFAGLGSSRALDLQAKKMAATYRLELFSPTGPWPNALFIDSAHLNQRGRERFLLELQNWWHSRK